MASIETCDKEEFGGGGHGGSQGECGEKQDLCGLGIKMNQVLSLLLFNCQETKGNRTY